MRPIRRWVGYRAAKAALNQIIRTTAIELKRTSPSAIIVGLHPGTVDSALSAPFQRSVAKDSLFAPDHAATLLLDVIEGLTTDDSGHCLDWARKRIAP